MDYTLEKMLPTWIENMVHNNGKLHDLGELKIDRDITHVVIRGGGESLGLDLNMDKVFTISNQSTIYFRTNLVVLTDGQSEVARKLEGAYKPNFDIAMASIVNPACRAWAAKSCYGFVHPLNAQGSPLLNGVNQIMETLCPLDTFILQAGCSMNAAVLVANQLMLSGQLPRVPIILNGVDYSYASYAEVPEGTETILSDHGKITTRQFLRYAQDLNTIYRGLRETSGFSLFTTGENTIVSEFIPAWVNPGVPF